MTFAEEKRKRLIALLNYIMDNPKIQKDKLVGHFCFEWGLRHQKVEEYLAELEAAGLITIEKQPETGLLDVFSYEISATEKAKEKVKELARGE